MRWWPGVLRLRNGRREPRHLVSIGSFGGSLSCHSDPRARAGFGSSCAGVGWTRYRRRLTTERKRGLGSHPATSEQHHRSESCARVATFSFLAASFVRSHAGSDRSLRRISEFRWVSAFVRRLPFFIFRPVLISNNTRRHVPITIRREDLARMRSDRPKLRPPIPSPGSTIAFAHAKCGSSDPMAPRSELRRYPKHFGWL